MRRRIPRSARRTVRQDRAGEPSRAVTGCRAAAWRHMGRLGAAIAGGALVWSSFPPIGWWPAAIAGCALLGWVLIHGRPTVRAGSAYGLVFGLAFYLPLLPWTGALVGVVPWLALSVLCALFPAVFTAVAVTLRPLPGWPIWWACAWTAVEWLKTSVPFGGFPWGVLAFGQSNGPLAQLAPWGGTALVSMTVTLAGFVVTAALTSSRGHRLRSLAGPVALIVALAVLAVVTGAGWQPWRSEDRRASVTVAAVQGNVPRLGLDFNAQRRAVLDNHRRQTELLAEQVDAGRLPQPDLVVWPENSSDIDPLANPDAAEQINAAADVVHAPILVGAVLTGRDPGTGSLSTSNTVIVWTPDDGPGTRHDKKILQPFGEYLPWRAFFRLFSDYADRAGFFVPGDGPAVLRVGDITVGVATCWEAVFDRAPRESVRNGAQILAIPTNNATFNETMSRQFLAFARVRALEHQRSVVVAGTTGVSTMITADGQSLDETEFFTADHLVSALELNRDLTPATLFAPSVQLVLTGMALIAALVSATRRPRARTRPEPLHAKTAPRRPTHPPIVY
ncbi:apolipoprotein N-acyltransferase [Mycolicibacterium cosmeticum]|nr:apolipoprotein N-acyltransferase [Mycolicibacterium cosmeticum]